MTPSMPHFTDLELAEMEGWAQGARQAEKYIVRIKENRACARWCIDQMMEMYGDPQHPVVIGLSHIAYDPIPGVLDTSLPGGAEVFRREWDAIWQEAHVKDGGDDDGSVLRSM